MSRLARQTPTPMTIAEFDAFVEMQPEALDYELVEGEVVLITYPNRRHEVIVSNIGAPLKRAMDRRGCRGAKLDFYKSIRTVMHISVVYQDQLRIEHYCRQPEGWVCDVLTRGSDMLHLEMVEFRLPVSQANFDIAF